MDNRYYPGVEVDVQGLVAELRKLFDEGDYEVQSMQVAQTAVLQARKTSCASRPRSSARSRNCGC